MLRKRKANLASVATDGHLEPNNQQQPLRPLPSNAAIIQGNDVLCRQILEAVATTDAHLPPRRLGTIVDLLWNVTGTGPFNGRFAHWTRSRAIRNMKDRVLAIIDHYSQYTTPYPTTLQSLAKRLHDESPKVQRELAQRREVLKSMNANNQREGDALHLNMLLHRLNANNQREGGFDALHRGAASLLAQNPRSQNNNGKPHYFFMIHCTLFSLRISLMLIQPNPFYLLDRHPLNP